MLVVEFERRVSDANMHLFQELKSNVGKFLCKASRTYLKMAKEHGEKDIWRKGLLPQQFLAAHNQIIRETHPLAAFLHTAIVKLGEQEVCTDEEFKKAYFEYRSKELDPKQARVQWRREHFSAIFQDNAIVRKRSIRTYNGIQKQAMYLHGISLKPTVPYATPIENQIDAMELEDM